MGRTRTVVRMTREQRAEERAAEEKEFADFAVPASSPPPPAILDDDPEFESVESFVDYLLGEDRTSFTLEEVQALQHRLHRSPGKVIADLKGYGLTYEGRPRVREVRGFTAWDNNLYAGNPMAGGSGHDQIQGFAGQKG